MSSDDPIGKSSGGPDDDSSAEPGPDLVEFPIDGVLDLHTFSPKDVKDLVPRYLGECLDRGITEVRIIHGKGTGTLKGIVHGILEKDPRVAAFEDADPAAGGWGTTLVRLKKGPLSPA
ncbi:MAG: Smr/MutS family protein [Acidobacteriota bacterium]